MSHRSGGDTKDRILEVSEREFAREGYAGAHLQRIAEQVGVQKTALYYYFPSKAALYGSVLTRMLEALDHTVAGAIDTGGAPEERLRRLLDALNDLLAEHRWYSRILLRVFVDPVRIDDARIPELIQSVVGRVLRFYREGVDAGEFSRVSSRHMFQSVFGSIFFHYASGAFGATVLDVEDLFSHDAIRWRRDEVKQLYLGGLLRSSADRKGDD